jgi:HAMP domain-containing protein
MMGLRIKFNLILVAIFAAGFLSVGVISYRYLQQQSIEDAKRAASVILDASAVANISPRIATSLGSRLIEMRVREVVENDVGGFDSEVKARVDGASSGTSSGTVSDVMAGPSATKVLVVARRVLSQDGPAKLRIVTIELDAVTATARLALTTLLSSMGIVFVAVYMVLNVMLDRLIVRPVAEMARQADAVSIGDFSIPEFKPASKDEIGVLGVAFNRMRRSTEEAIKLLKHG